jgi:four helix bundle protein
MKIERFEQIEAWKEARTLTKQIYKMTGRSRFSKDFGLKDQIQRASVSVMSNIAEGFDSYRNKEFVRFLEYAKRSASEVQSELYVALDQNYVNQDEFDVTYQLASTCKKLIVGFMKYLSGREQKK